MHYKNKAAWCAGLAALALGIPAGARAETLIYVTSSAIGTVDSSAPSSDNTSGNNGPLSYSLPSGYYTIGAKVSYDAETLFLLAYNGSTCELFSVNANGGSDGAADLTGVQSFNCSISSGAGDFGFIDGTGGSALDEYVVANGAELYEIGAGGASSATLSVENSSGGTANVVGVINVGGSEQLAVDASVDDLVELNLGSSPVTESGISALGFAPSTNTALDYSVASGTYYLYSGGELYGSTAPGSGFSALGGAVGGTVSMTAAENVAVNNSGGGAFGPAALLPLLGLAALRRKRRAA